MIALIFQAGVLLLQVLMFMYIVHPPFRVLFSNHKNAQKMQTKFEAKQVGYLLINGAIVAATVNEVKADETAPGAANVANSFSLADGTTGTANDDELFTDVEGCAAAAAAAYEKKLVADYNAANPPAQA